MRYPANDILYPSVWRNGLSMSTTAVFLFSLMCIPATLALPRVINISGYIGIVVLGFCAITTLYTGILLSKAWVIATKLHGECKGPISDPYQLLAEKCYGQLARYIVSCCIYVELFGKAVVLLLLVSSSTQILVSSFGLNISFCFWMMLLGAVLIPCSIFASPKDYWFQSMLALLTTLAACIVIMVDIVWYTDPSKEVKHSDITFVKLSTMLGTVMYIFGGHSIYLTIQTDMKKSNEFQWAITFCNLVIIALLYPVVGAGYVYNGDEMEANVLSSLPIANMTTAVTVLIVITLMFGIMITLNPIFQFLELILYIPPKVITFKRCIVRSLAICVVTFVAESVPRFDAILILIGGSTTAVTSFICPILFYTKMYNKNEYYEEISNEGLVLGSAGRDCNRLSVWIIALNAIIVIFGLAAGVSATGTALVYFWNPGTITVPCFYNTTIQAWL